MPTRYQPQQSVLKPQSGQRHTACIRYMSPVPQRSQSIASSPQAAVFEEVSVARPGSPVPSGASSGGVSFVCAIAGL